MSRKHLISSCGLANHVPYSQIFPRPWTPFEVVDTTSINSDTFLLAVNFTLWLYSYITPTIFGSVFLFSGVSRTHDTTEVANIRIATCIEYTIGNEVTRWAFTFHYKGMSAFCAHTIVFFSCSMSSPSPLDYPRQGLVSRVGLTMISYLDRDVILRPMRTRFYGREEGWDIREGMGWLRAGP